MSNVKRSSESPGVIACHKKEYFFCKNKHLPMATIFHRKNITLQVSEIRTKNANGHLLVTLLTRFEIGTLRVKARIL